MPEILPKILVVDDDRHTRILFDRLLARTAVVSLAVDGAEARRLFAAEDFNLVLMDQRLPSDNGIDLLREFRARRPHLVGILMTGFADVRDAVAAVRAGRVHKPLSGRFCFGTIGSGFVGCISNPCCTADRQSSVLFRGNCPEETGFVRFLRWGTGCFG